MPVSSTYRILVIGLVWPEPKSTAAGSHMLSLLKLFRRQGWTVDFASPAQATGYQANLETLGIDCHSIRVNDSSFDRWLSRIKPDFVLFDRFIMEEQFAWRVEQIHPQAVRILDTEDLQFLRHARQQAVKQQRALQPRDLHNETAMRECASIYRSDLSLIISDYEQQLLTRQFNVSPELLHHLPFMLDAAQRRINPRPYAERAHFVSIGNFRHPPNWDSVLQLKQLWPRIRAALPQAELHIYGAYTPKKATQLDDPASGFLIKGRAEDAIATLSQARLCLAPLRFGAGLKGKLLDAMRAGTPSVTTKTGAEGMSGNLAWPGAITHSEQDFITQAIQLYREPQLWQQAQVRIRPLLDQMFCAERLQPQFIQRLICIKTHLKSHRAHNFTGQMLNYHLLKSTRYLSKWIEAKNHLRTFTDT